MIPVPVWLSAARHGCGPTHVPPVDVISLTALAWRVSAAVASSNFASPSGTTCCTVTFTMGSPLLFNPAPALAVLTTTVTMLSCKVPMVLAAFQDQVGVEAALAPFNVATLAAATAATHAWDGVVQGDAATGFSLE